MATLMEGKECITCNTKGPDIHLCNPEVQEQKIRCKYCGTEGITSRHICKEKLGHLSHICKNCGRVSDNPTNLCYPVEINAARKTVWLSIPIKGRDVATCQNCDQPIEPPGHICDPVLPYMCKYCRQKVTNSRHMCKEIIDQAKYTCKLCGRIAVEESDLCSSWELK